MRNSLIRSEEITREYEQTRTRNKSLLGKRRAEVYEKIPRIKEIEDQGKLSYIRAARMRVLGEDAQGKQTQSASADNRKLTEEKRKLLIAAGYPADYLEEIFDCPQCMDTGYVDGARCKCFAKKLVQALYVRSNLQNVLMRENFSTFDLSYYGDEPVEGKPYTPKENMTRVFEKAKSFADDFSANRTNGNILIYGETGLGKTFLTNCIAKSVMDAGHPVLYLSANELFEEILGPFIMEGNSELKEIFDLIYDSALLIIDDLGTEFTNGFVCSQLFEIVNRRGLLGRSTLISTNLSMHELDKRYTERVVSRFVADYTVFHIYGENIRYQKRKNIIQAAQDKQA